MNDARAKIASVAAFSQRYREEFLDQPPDDPGPDEDPFRLRFLLKRAFASARSETVSTQYRKHTEAVLREHEDRIRGRWKESDGGITDEELQQALADQGVGNQHDRKMVIELVDLLSILEEHDIIEYTKHAVRHRTIDGVFNALTEVHNIGPKKATLYLRDVVTHWELEQHVEGDQYRYLVPIDTWVYKIGDQIGVLSTDSPNWKTNSTEIVDACGDEVSPIAYDQGAWYLGANAFDVLIGNLENLDPDDD